MSRGDEEFISVLRERAESAEAKLASVTAYCDERNSIIAGLREQYDAELCQLLGQINGLREQHGRDSAELRRLCQARDDFRKERDEWKAAASEFHLERDAAMAELEKVVADSTAAMNALSAQSIEFLKENTTLRAELEAEKRPPLLVGELKWRLTSSEVFAMIECDRMICPPGKRVRLVLEDG